MDPNLDPSDPELFELTGFGPGLSGSKTVHRPLVLVFRFSVYASFLAVSMWPFPFSVCVFGQHYIQGVYSTDSNINLF
jgi:hypothetical protein